MAQNVLDDLLAEAQFLLTECKQAEWDAAEQLKEAEQNRLIQEGIVRGVEMAIERLAGQPAEG